MVPLLAPCRSARRRSIADLCGSRRPFGSDGHLTTIRWATVAGEHACSLMSVSAGTPIRGPVRT